jgi:hypothetical protein
MACPGRAAFYAGSAMLAGGSGVMAPMWALSRKVPGLPEWNDTPATTIGDTLLLPILAASLTFAFTGLRAIGDNGSAGGRAIALGGFLGLAGGVTLQVSWLLASKPHLTWILPAAHRFSLRGWYHAAFLCAAAAVLTALFFGAACRLRRVVRDDRTEIVDRVLRSPVLFATMACIWSFAALVAPDRSDGASGWAATVAVIVPSAAAFVVCAVCLRSHFVHALPTLMLALAAALAVLAAVASSLGSHLAFGLAAVALGLAGRMMRAWVFR